MKQIAIFFLMCFRSALSLLDSCFVQWRGRRVTFVSLKGEALPPKALDESSQFKLNVEFKLKVYRSVMARCMLPSLRIKS